MNRRAFKDYLIAIRTRVRKEIMEDEKKISIRIQRIATAQELFDLHGALCRESFELLKLKQHDYADADDPFSNLRSAALLGINPFQLILSRIQEKVLRLNTLVEKGGLKNESARDSILDIINYAVLAQGIIQEGDEKS